MLRHKVEQLGRGGGGGDLFLSALSITAVALNILPTAERFIDGGWCILAGPRWPRLPQRDRDPQRTPGPYYSAIYISEYHSSKPAFAVSLQLWGTIRPVCDEGRTDRDMIISLLMSAGKKEAHDRRLFLHRFAPRVGGSGRSQGLVWPLTSGVTSTPTRNQKNMERTQHFF